MKIMESKMYETIDLSLAAYLSVAGFKIDAVDIKRSRRRATMCFEMTEELSKAVSDFFGGDARVNPVEYFNTIRNLKSRINNELEGN
jgi:hypothetical protein